MHRNQMKGAGRGRRVLVVEDDGHSRRISAVALSSSGFEVHEAADGEEGVSLALSLHPDLVVMDLGLPGMNGFEATRRIKQEASPRAPLVLVLTARVLREDVEAARKAGCDSLLAKPIDPFDLVHEVKRLLDARESGP